MDLCFRKSFQIYPDYPKGAPRSSLEPGTMRVDERQRVRPNAILEVGFALAEPLESHASPEIETLARSQESGQMDREGGLTCFFAYSGICTHVHAFAPGTKSGRLI